MTSMPATKLEASFSCFDSAQINLITGFTQGRSLASAGPAFRLVLDRVGVSFEGVLHCARDCSFDGVALERAPSVCAVVYPKDLALGCGFRPDRVFAGVVDWGMILSRWV